MEHSLFFTKKQGRLIMAVMLAFFLFFSAVLISALTKNTRATDAVVPEIRLVGEYKIADGEWLPIVPGKHISACKGDVRLRGCLELRHPETDELLGKAEKGLRVGVYLNHINMSVLEPDGEKYMSDTENPIIGEDACGQVWESYDYRGDSGEIELVFHNPHAFGNEGAVDDFLNSARVYSGNSFEKEVLASGQTERLMGITIIISALIVMGFGIFSALLHMELYKSILPGGIMLLSAGIYFVFSSRGISFLSETVILNTLIKGAAPMLYMLSAFLLIGSFVGGRAKKAAITAALLYGLLQTFIFATAAFSDVYFYDLLGLWTALTAAAALIYIIIISTEAKGMSKGVKAIAILSLVGLTVFLLDAPATLYGWWRPGTASKIFFVALFFISMLIFLRIVPKSINAAEAARRLEAERAALDAELTKSRVSTMISQIRPHFIYNTLGSIEQLCELDPPMAARLVNEFSAYLRGNFSELDNTELISFSREMEHTGHYIGIEKVRFPDIEFIVETEAEDFDLPALTVQPVVENAIKHGLMKKSCGGTVKITAYETESAHCVCVEDDGVGYSTAEVSDKGSIGLKNIRGRLEAMCGGGLKIESEPGKGTRVTIEIPKEEAE